MQSQLLRTEPWRSPLAQHDLLWEQLTPAEHLSFYGRLKGLQVHWNCFPFRALSFPFDVFIMEASPPETGTTGRMLQGSLLHCCLP